MVSTIVVMPAPDNTEIQNAWGRNLAAARTAAGLTQEDLANQLGVSVVTVARWEVSMRRPALADQTRIAETLTVPVTALFPRTGDEAALLGIAAEYDELLARTGNGCS